MGLKGNGTPDSGDQNCRGVLPVTLFSDRRSFNLLEDESTYLASPEYQQDIQILPLSRCI